jgi:hypothetical protein
MPKRHERGVVVCQFPSVLRRVPFMARQPETIARLARHHREDRQLAFTMYS